MTEPRAPHLLLVDDDRLILSTLASGLRHTGYIVSTTGSAQEAEAFLAGGVRPDLAILDIQMPDTDGLALADRLRDFDHIPFVMLSAYSDAASVEKATRAGALGYLVKPMDVVQMMPAIEAAMGRAKEMRGLQSHLVQLQNALTAERDISVAVGITMVEQSLCRQAAFDVLRAQARGQRRKLADLAQEVVQARDAR